MVRCLFQKVMDNLKFQCLLSILLVLFLVIRVKVVLVKVKVKQVIQLMVKVNQELVKPVKVKGKYFLVELPPSTSLRVDAGMRRFVNQPSYAFPWHGGDNPIPFP